MGTRLLLPIFLADLPALAASGRPFFSFLFYDLPHSFSLPEAKNTHFQPAWQYAAYTELNNDTDPTSLFNLYRNCCYEDDAMIGSVLHSMKLLGLMDNTVIVVVGDHGQEFNENKKNYWTHSGNSSRWQIATPLICHFPHEDAARYDHRTTHYDIAPHIMSRFLGVKNPIDDYGMGCLLTDTAPRLWHFVGHYRYHYTFLIENDIIIQKSKRGAFEILDRELNPISDYKLDVDELDKAIRRVNSFYK